MPILAALNETVDKLAALNKIINAGPATTLCPHPPQDALQPPARALRLGLPVR